jgi:hypothetical protein
VILLAVGTALTMTGTPVVPILAFYGLFFLLVLPLYRLGAKPLAVIAGAWALVGPQLLYLLKPVVGDRSFPTVGHADGIVSLLFTGGCPALTGVPFVIAGMAVARLDLAATAVRIRLALTGVALTGVALAATAVRIRLALTGVALAVTGYGGSWPALRLVPGAAEAIREAEGGPAMSSMSSAPPGGVGVFGDTPAGLLVASPHSEATRPARSYGRGAVATKSMPRTDSMAAAMSAQSRSACAESCAVTWSVPYLSRFPSMARSCIPARMVEDPNSSLGRNPSNQSSGRSARTVRGRSTPRK